MAVAAAVKRLCQLLSLECAPKVPETQEDETSWSEFLQSTVNAVEAHLEKAASAERQSSEAHLRQVNLGTVRTPIVLVDAKSKA